MTQSIEKLFDHKNDLKRIIIPADDKSLSSFVQSYVQQCIKKFDYNPDQTKIYLIPTLKPSTLATLLAAYDPLYRACVFDLAR